MKQAFLLLATSLVTLFMSPGEAVAANPATCAGYPQARQFVEGQSWWTRTAGKTGSNFGHLHIGACIPERANLTRDQTLSVRVVLHRNPGEFVHWSLVLKGTDYETTVQKHYARQWTCPRRTCIKWWKVRLRLSDFGHSGLQEIRFRAFVDEPDGNRMTASLNWQTYVWNGKSRDDVTRRAWVRGKGWYTGSGYCEAAVKSVPLPDGRIRRHWSPYLSIVWHGEEDDLAVTHHTVRLDSDFHMGKPGVILRDGDGAWEGRRRISMRALANGMHKLFLRADCEDPRGSTNSGALVISFVKRAR